MTPPIARRLLESYVASCAHRARMLADSLGLRAKLAIGALALPALLACLSGCSGAPEPTYPVEGTVRLDGKPLTHGGVLFQSIPSATDAKPYTARGTIQSDGSYRLSTFDQHDGAVEGRHRAVVIVGSLVPPEGETHSPEPLIPAKYASPNTSGLQYEVQPHSSTIDIELSSK